MRYRLRLVGCVDRAVVLASFLCLALATNACSETRNLVAGHARPGQIGYGTASQSSSLFGESVAEVGTAAISPSQPGRDGDAVWRIEQGGHQLQYCRVVNELAACQKISVPQIKWAFVPTLPVKILAYGLLEVTPVTPNHSIWVSDRSGLNLYSCSIGDEVPTCYAAKIPGGRAAATVVLGNQLIRTPAGLRDVLWTSHLGVMVVRCETSARAPTPSCAVATM